MIKDINKTRVLEFGTGDVCVSYGYFKYDCGKSFVTFSNQEAGEIGSVGEVKAGQCALENFPVVMIFSKKESIDVIIEALQKARESI